MTDHKPITPEELEAWETDAPGARSNFWDTRRRLVAEVRRLTELWNSSQDNEQRTFAQLTAQVMGLEADNARLRGALERIHAFADVMERHVAVQICDDALKGKEPRYGEDLEALKGNEGG